MVAHSVQHVRVADAHLPAQICLSRHRMPKLSVGIFRIGQDGPAVRDDPFLHLARRVLHHIVQQARKVRLFGIGAVTFGEHACGIGYTKAVPQTVIAELFTQQSAAGRIRIRIQAFLRNVPRDRFAHDVRHILSQSYTFAHVGGTDLNGIEILQQNSAVRIERLALFAHGRANGTKLADVVRTVPRIEALEHVGADQQIQLLARVPDMQRFERLDRVAPAAAVYLHRADLERRFAEQQTAHLHARFGVRKVGRLLVRRNERRDHQHAREREPCGKCTRQAQMPQMRRVERAAEYSDRHLI